MKIPERFIRHDRHIEARRKPNSYRVRRSSHAPLLAEKKIALLKRRKPAHRGRFVPGLVEIDNEAGVGMTIGDGCRCKIARRVSVGASPLPILILKTR